MFRIREELGGVQSEDMVGDGLWRFGELLVSHPGPHAAGPDESGAEGMLAWERWSEAGYTYKV